MNALRYHENKQRGSADFPLEYYYIYEHHERYQMPYHWHEEFELLRVVQGTLTLSCDENVAVLEKGDVVFIPAGCLHGGEPHDCVYECVVFDMRFLLKCGESCKKTISDIINRVVAVEQVYLPGSPIAREALHPMFDAIRDKGAGYELITLGCLYRFVGEALARGLTRPIQAGREDKRVLKLKTVFELIEREYQTDLTLGKLSAAAGMTPKYFCRFFKAATHRTPMDYLNFYRVEAACVQLAASDESNVTRAALDAGFADVNYFIRTFRKYKGMTPGQYVKQMHEQGV